MGAVVNQAATFSQKAFALFLIFKGLAYSVSLGSARGGPTFPAMFLGIVAGLLCAHLPGFAEEPAVAALMGAATVSILRLPLASIIIAMVVSQAGASHTTNRSGGRRRLSVVLGLSASRSSDSPRSLIAKAPSADGHGTSPRIATDEIQQ